MKRFIACVMEQFGFTEDEAIKIFRYYQHAKVVEQDGVTGDFKLYSGIFWDKDMMTRALALSMNGM